MCMNVILCGQYNTRVYTPLSPSGGYEWRVIDVRSVKRNLSLASSLACMLSERLDQERFSQ